MTKARRPHNAYFLSQIEFTEKHIAEFRRRGFADDLVQSIATNLSDTISFYATDPILPREEKRRLRAIERNLTACSDSLAAVDSQTASILDMRARPLGSDIKFRELCEEIKLFREAAKVAIEKIKAPETGPDATKAIAIAINIGKTLRNFNIHLDAKAAGKFVIATGIVFESLGIAKANPRIDVRRALEFIEKSAR